MSGMLAWLRVWVKGCRFGYGPALSMEIVHSDAFFVLISCGGLNSEVSWLKSKLRWETVPSPPPLIPTTGGGSKRKLQLALPVYGPAGNW